MRLYRKVGRWMKTLFINNQNLHLIQKQAPSCVIALGYFDGVHLGHQQVIITARKEANKRGLPLAVMSFRPHPIDILSKGKRIVPHLTTICEKEKRLKQLDVDLFYLVDFTFPFATLTSSQFVEDYLMKLRVVHAVAGFDFSYGAKGVAKLPQIVTDSNGEISVTKVNCIDYNGEKISSSAIRHRLLTAAVHEIPHFLGNYYTSKVHWDGYEFQQIEKTMLPLTGTYKVILENLNYKTNAYISINIADQIQPLEIQKPLPKGVFSIHWLQNVKNAVLSQAIL